MMYISYMHTENRFPGLMKQKLYKQNSKHQVLLITWLIPSLRWNMLVAASFSLSTQTTRKFT